MLIGLAAALLFYVLWLIATNGDRWREPFSTLIVSLFVGCIGGALAISMPVSYAMVDKIEVEHKIRVMKDGSETQGSFFLGSGSVDGEPAFMYYEVDENGAARLKDVDADRASVVETDGTPRVVQECDDFRDVPEFLTFPINMFTDGGIDCYGDYTFYVPKGSIRDGYVLDAE